MQLINYFYQFITTPATHKSSPKLIFWFSLSLAFTALYCSISVEKVFSSEYVFHDDVRSHVFWMYRFLDPSLFPNDLIADYFQSVAPHGYSSLYYLMTKLGIDPVVFSKFLPIPLVFITAIYCFFTCLQIFPLPSAAFLSTLWLNQNIWATNDVASATPRAFLYPLFLAFLYYLLKRSLILCIITIILQGLFYPQTLFISAGILSLRLLRIEKWRVRFSPEKQDYIFFAVGLGFTALMLLPYALQVSDYGPVTTGAEGKQLLIMQQKGRKEFFYPNPWLYWFCGERCGMIPYDWCRTFPPPQAWFAVLLPWLLNKKYYYQLASKISDNVSILWQILASSLGMFFLAHALLFKLHLPSRYTKHSVRILVAIAGAIALIILANKVYQFCQQNIQTPTQKQWLLSGFIAFLLLMSFGYPLILREFPNAAYHTAYNQTLYPFFAEKPKDIMIASLSETANDIPTLSRRSVLASSETANPYHMGYYKLIEERTIDLMLAHYNPTLDAAKYLIDKYSIDFFLVEANTFTPEYIKKYGWLREVKPIAPEAISRMKQGITPALAKLIPSCQIFETEGQIVLDAQCIKQATL